MDAPIFQSVDNFVLFVEFKIKYGKDKGNRVFEELSKQWG